MNLFICVWLLYISSACWLCFCQCRLWGTWVNRWGISFRRSPRLTKISTQSTWERCLLSMLQLLSRQCGLLSDHGLIRGLKRKLKFMALTSLQSYLSWLIARTSLCSSEAHAVAQEDARMQMLALGMKVPTRRNRLLMNLWRHWISCVDLASIGNTFVNSLIQSCCNEVGRICLFRLFNKEFMESLHCHFCNFSQETLECLHCVELYYARRNASFRLGSCFVKQRFQHTMCSHIVDWLVVTSPAQ